LADFDISLSSQNTADKRLTGKILRNKELAGFRISAIPLRHDCFLPAEVVMLARTVRILS
jgi:hypothetical protein